jgi:hypothetical protein
MITSLIMWRTAEQHNNKNGQPMGGKNENIKSRNRARKERRGNAVTKRSGRPGRIDING